MDKKKEYEAPQLTVAVVKTEAGYAASALNTLLFWEASATQQVEDYTVHDTWNNDSGFWQ